MAEKPTYGELENKVKKLENEIVERNQTEDALRQNLELLQTFVGNIDVVLTVIGTDYKIQWVSPTVSKWFDKDPSEFVGKYCYQIFEQKNSVCDYCPAVKAIATGKPNEAETQGIRPDGSTFIVRDRVFPIIKKGKVIAFNEIVEDITERKEAEQYLQESEERYRSFVQNFQGIAFRGKMDFTPIFFHGAVEEITGYSEDEFVVGNPRWDQVIHPDDFGVVLAEQEKKLHSVPGYTYEREYRIIREDRQIRWVHEIIQNICDDSGQPIMLQGAIYDITARKLTEEALRKNEEKYRLLVENANDAILIIQDERIKFFNPVALKLMGYTANEFLDMSFKVFIHPQDRAKVVDRYRKRIKGKDAISTYNCRVISKQQKTIWAQVNAIRTLWEEKEATLTFLRDITQLKQAESRLQHTERMESLGTLAGGIAHDFNNILSAIIGYTELSLIDADKGTLLENNLQEVNKAGTRARDLVKQILAFARQSDEEQKPLKVNIIANEVLNLIRSTIPTTIEVKENIQSHSVIMGNQSQVHQLFMNLCTNAAQAMEDSGGILEVDLSDVKINDHLPLPISGLKPGNYLKITVSDTGPGIPPDIIDSIFEPYFTTKGVGKGTGMGLALAHGIVESYGGKITVDSELGKGAVFSIYLPITAKHTDHPSYEKEDLATGVEKILFVDDEMSIADLGRKLLERLGYHVTVRTSSVEALEAFGSKPYEFDLVITDMTMPNMTGDGLAAELIKIRPGIPIILCTGYSKRISEKSAAKIGIKAFAYKPIVIVDLAKTVRRVLDEAKDSVDQ